MTTPFDPTRLDEECRNIAIEFTNSDGYGAIWGSDVKAVLLGRNRPCDWPETSWKQFVQRVYNRCRRPKMVKA
jgi:hypothetical protein